MADFASKYAFAFEDSSESDEDVVLQPLQHKKEPSPVKTAPLPVTVAPQTLNVVPQQLFNEEDSMDVIIPKNTIVV